MAEHDSYSWPEFEPDTFKYAKVTIETDTEIVEISRLKLENPYLQSAYYADGFYPLYDNTPGTAYKLNLTGDVLPVNGRVFKYKSKDPWIDGEVVDETQEITTGQKELD